MTLKKSLQIAANLGFLAVFFMLFREFASWNTLVATFSRIPMAHLIIGFASLILTYFLRAHRFYILLNHHQVQWLSIFKVMLQHNAINNILPFRLGELSFPILLKQRENIGLASSAKTLITARLFDFLVMGMAAFGVLMLILNNNQRLVFISVMILVALVGGIGLVFVLKKSQRIHDIFSRFYTYLIANFKSCSAITLAIWLFKILGLAALLSPMLNTEIELALLAVLVVEGTAILPINGPANFGSLEGAVVAILLPFGLVAGEVFGAVLNLHLAIIMLAAIGYLASFLIPNTHHS